MLILNAFLNSTISFWSHIVGLFAAWVFPIGRATCRVYLHFFSLVSGLEIAISVHSCHSSHLYWVWVVGGGRGWPGDTRSPLTSPASGSWTLLQPPSQRVGSSAPGRATPGPESPPSPPRVLPSEPRPGSPAGIRGGAPHPLPGPRRCDRGHQGHLHPPEDPQVRPRAPGVECSRGRSSPPGNSSEHSPGWPPCRTPRTKAPDSAKGVNARLCTVSTPHPPEDLLKF